MAILNQYNFYPLKPKDCLDITFEQSFAMLKQIVGEKELNRAFDISTPYPSPIINQMVPNRKNNRHKSEINKDLLGHNKIRNDF